MRHVRPNRRRGMLVLSGISLFTVTSITPWNARGGTMRADVSYTAYTSWATNYPSVGATTFFSVALNQTFLASGILISPEWVLSAGHAVSQPEGMTFNIGGTSYTNGTNYSTDQHFANPGWNPSGDPPEAEGTDIGLIHLTTPVTGIAPASRNFVYNPLGMVGTEVGYGLTGTGITGGQPTGTGTFAPGVKHASTNAIDAQGDDFDNVSFPQGTDVSPNVYGSDFDNPSNSGSSSFGSGTPTPLEGSISTGDSGGGIFINTQSDFSGRNYVAGVISFIGTSDASHPGKYGDVFGWTNVTAYNQWIDDNIAAYWTSPSNGSFASAANWGPVGMGVTSAVPDSGGIAGFNQTGSYTVSFGASTSNYQLLARGGDVTLDLGGFNYNLTSTAYDGALVVGRYSGETASITIRNGNLITHDAIVGHLSGSAGTITVGSGATWTVNGDAYIGGSFDGPGGAGTVSVQAPGEAMNVNGNLTVFGGSQVSLASGGNKVLRVQGLTIASGGKIDLADNDMIIDYTGSSPLASVQSLINTGRNGGNWTGAGLTSSVAAAHTNTGLGYGENSTLGLGSFDGVPVDSTSIIVKYTYYGDANLDGKVDLSDLKLLAQHWNTTGDVWTGGDFNGDGVVNIQDLYLLAKDWQDGVSNPLGPSLAPLLTSLGLPTDFSNVAVPEPSSLALLACTIVGLSSRRRINRRGN